MPQQSLINKKILQKPDDLDISEDFPLSEDEIQEEPQTRQQMKKSVADESKNDGLSKSERQDMPSDNLKQSDKLDALQIRKRARIPKIAHHRQKNSEKANWKDLEFDILNELKDENEKHDHDDGQDPDRDSQVVLNNMVGDNWHNNQTVQVNATIHTISGL